MCSDSCPIIYTIETDDVNTKGFGFPLHSQSVLHCHFPWLTLVYRHDITTVMVSYILHTTPSLQCGRSLRVSLPNGTWSYREPEGI